MDELEYRAARLDQMSQMLDHPRVARSQNLWDLTCRSVNQWVVAITNLGGETFADSDVHDTGECCCDSM